MVGITVLLALGLAVAGPAQARKYPGPTYSSPIAMSADGKFVWSVNPGADNVAVIYTKTNKVLTRVKVGDEPQSVALDPNNRYAYVANAASGTVTGVGSGQRESVGCEVTRPSCPTARATKRRHPRATRPAQPPRAPPRQGPGTFRWNRMATRRSPRTRATATPTVSVESDEVDHSATVNDAPITDVIA